MSKWGVALITARSGSKGFPNKNIAKLNGLTLIEYAINAAKKSKKISDIYISTDSNKYEDIALAAGAMSFGLRDKSLATDTSSSVDVISNFLRQFSKVPDYVVLLQPTSPVRTGVQIDECVELHLESSRTVVTVSKVDEPHPYKMKKMNGDGCLEPFIEETDSTVRRQDLPEVYQLTGAIYVIASELILKSNKIFTANTLPYVVGDFANVDSESDFDYLQYKLHQNKLELPT